MKTVEIKEIAISKSGNIMVIDGNVSIKTNLKSLPEWASGVKYDENAVEDYNGGKYVRGTLTVGLSSFSKEKLKFVKELEA